MALREGTRRLSRQCPDGLLTAWNDSFRYASTYSSHNTSFGFRQVPEEEKGKLVGDVFTSVASKYDLMNDLMTLGLHRLWKDRLVSKLSPFPGMQHLDVAGGTGDVAFRVLEAIKRVEQRSLQVSTVDAPDKDETRVHVCDINPAMLDVGKQRAKQLGMGELPTLVWVEGDAEKLEFKDNSMDGYTIAFGIRNVTHISKVLEDRSSQGFETRGTFFCVWNSATWILLVSSNCDNGSLWLWDWNSGHNF